MLTSTNPDLYHSLILSLDALIIVSFSFCGKYEHPEDEDFVIDRVFMKDGDLYADAVSEEYGEFTFRLYPIGENEFGRKGGMLKVIFGEGCLKFDDYTCKKR